MPAIAGYKIDGYRTRFMAGAENIFTRDQQGTWGMCTEEIPTEGALQVTIKMGGATPLIRQWVGDKQFGSFRELSKTITTAPHEASMELERRQVEGEPAGVINRKIDQFLRGQPYIKDKLVWEKFLTNPTGIDGVAIFSTTHPFGSSTTWSNKTTDSLSFTAYKSAKNAMREIKDEAGEYLDLQPTHLFVGPDLERTALEVTNCDTRPIIWTTAGAEATSGTANSAIGITNVYKGEVTVVVVNRFSNGTNDADWALLDASKGAMPIGLAVMRPPVALSRTGETDEHRFMRDMYQFSIEADLAPDGLYPYAVYGKLT